MNYHKGTYLAGVFKGLQCVLAEAAKLQESECHNAWNHSIIRNVAEQTSTKVNEKLKEYSELDVKKVEKNISEVFGRTSMIFEGLSVFTQYTQGNRRERLRDYDLQIPTELTLNVDLDNDMHGKSSENSALKVSRPAMSESDVVSQHESRLRVEVAAALTNPHSGEVQLQSGSIIEPANMESKSSKEPGKSKIELPVIPTAKKSKHVPHLSEKAKERAVPASRMARVVSFGTLAAGLGLGTVAELTRRTFGLSDRPSVGTTLESAFITPANAERIVDTLCKVRGAALKIGQIFSIQDSNIVNPEFQKLFERVRQSADFMPTWQVENVMKEQLGDNWREKFRSFEIKPFAAASIGQVHCGTLVDGRDVAVKIQYPGVAKGIESDIDNLMSVLKFWNIFPPGVFIDNLVEVAKKELAWEVDYVREAECTKRFKKLLEKNPEYYVPTVIDDLCSSQVFTTELIEGIPVDKCVDMNFEDRCHISMLIQNLVLKEMFEFHYMQTDPNWSNFFYDPETRRLILLDFGATRSYDKKFMDQYLHVVKAALDGNREKVLLHSEQMGFLTGYESKIMKDAHVDAVMILGEILRKHGFDFGVQNTVGRIQDLIPTIVNHRLCPPPEEVYSLHRKLSGAFLLYTKLKARLSCHDMFMRIYNQYRFDET